MLLVDGGRQHDDVAGARVRAGEPQRQLVGLAAGTHEVAHAQRGRERAGQTLRVRRQRVVQVSRVRVQDAQLVRRRAHDARMAVADVRHVVVRIEVLPARRVEEQLPPSAHDLERLSIPDAEVTTDSCAARRHRTVHLNRAVRECHVAPVQQRRRIRRECHPGGALGRAADTREVTAETEQVGDDLDLAGTAGAGDMLITVNPHKTGSPRFDAAESA